MNYVLAIDQGTTGTTALLVDQELNHISEATVDFEQYFPKPGWVEHDLEDIWSTVLQTVREVTKHIDPRRIAAIGIANQRETLCFWDRKTTEPLARAIVWQDRRTTGLCERLRDQGHEPYFQNKTGLLLDPYFSGPRAAWALEHCDAVKRAHRQGRLAMGSIDSFLVARMSDGSVHATDPTNAARTLCFDLLKHQWDEELCGLLGIPMDLWPEVRPSCGIFALTDKFAGLPDEIPISGVLGDQQAALLGQACLKETSAKCTYGTGSFFLVNTGRKPIKSKHRLISTIAWALNEDDYVYALEGSAFIAGAAVHWLRDGLKMIQESGEIETLAASVPSSEGVIFVPSLTGLAAPYWYPDATGMFTGLTRGTTDAHLARAVLEGIAFQNVDILTAIQRDLGHPITSLKVDGGASVNNLLMQIQANQMGISLHRSQCLATTSMGAAFAAGLGAALWTDFSELEKNWKENKTFKPEWNKEQRNQAYEEWNDAIARVTWHRKHKPRADKD